MDPGPAAQGSREAHPGPGHHHVGPLSPAPVRAVHDDSGLLAVADVRQTRRAPPGRHRAGAARGEGSARESVPPRGSAGVPPASGTPAAGSGCATSETGRVASRCTLAPAGGGGEGRAPGLDRDGESPGAEAFDARIEASGSSSGAACRGAHALCVAPAAELAASGKHLPPGSRGRRWSEGRRTRRGGGCASPARHTGAEISGLHEQGAREDQGELELPARRR